MVFALCWAVPKRFAGGPNAAPDCLLNSLLGMRVLTYAYTQSARMFMIKEAINTRSHGCADLRPIWTRARSLMASHAPFDPFAALGLPRDASTATIRATYRQLVRRYHPNRHQGSEESKTALSEQFQTVHQAWKYLCDPVKRRRYLELLQLAEEQEGLLARMHDLLNSDEHTEEQDDGRAAVQAQHDGYLSSDAEDDLPHVGLKRRQTLLKRTPTLQKQFGTSSEVTSPPRRNKSSRTGAPTPAHGTEKSAGEGDYFATRRKKLEKLRRKELAAFEQYKNAMVEKFEAEMETERTRDLYDRAKWRRDYFERAPRETTERLRSFQQFMSAFRAFGQQSRRRNRPTLSYGGQILSTEDLHGSDLLAPDSVRSPSKADSSHQRGWSSDISGDQESSDEHSSGPSTPRPQMSFTWQRQHSRYTSLDAFQLPSVVFKSGSITTSRPSLPENAPSRFKMIVKRPTGLGDMYLNDDDSSPESSSVTPRTPSPDNAACANRYTLVQTRRLSDVLRSGQSRSPPPPNSREDRDSHSHIGAPISSDAIHFVIKRIGQPRYRHVAFQNVHVLSYEEKLSMLGAQPDADADPSELMQRLSCLDLNVSSKFIVKPDMKKAFVFRLIYDHREIVKDHHQTFIALSYRRKHHVEKHHGFFTLPLDDEMFQAVWDERVANEGVWIDQICIKQESREETTTSMSAMDMVYRSARLVVVALDDIELNADERCVLERHMEEYTQMLHVSASKRFRGKQPAYLETHDDLFQLLCKIFGSSWFRRAWCRHEMRLARDHVFLIPCKSLEPTGKSIVRFTSSCLTHLLALSIEVPFEMDIELVKPALHAFFRDRSKLGPHEKHLRSHHGNFTTVVAEVLGMEAGGDPRIAPKQRAADAMKDKISIILNTMECGLALTAEMRDPTMPLNKSECHYMLLMLALAAQDPGALCSVGPPMRLTQAYVDSPLTPTASSTWLFEPTNVDSGLNNYRTLHRLPASARIDTGLELGEHYVQLDLRFLTSNEVKHGFDDPATMEIASHFLDVCKRRKFGRNRIRYLVTDVAANRHFGSMADVYTQTLACVLECGPDWVEDVCLHYGVGRWKQDGEGAWNLLVALKNTSGRWPESAWNAQAAGFIADFVNFLVIRGMPQRQILHREEWRPIWVSRKDGGKIITFVPPGEIEAAVPAALLDDDYIQLARLWLLQPRTLSGAAGDPTCRWTLLGKSVIFSNSPALQEAHTGRTDIRDQQRVFGREDPEIQRLLRERSLYY
ncbi:hypothetical protein LTR35_000811 [Friedmanniomyces endolithicus]|uniref:J domain-containing protein n=1 Tax=Friedmanniomyces endolithicus TaxID=329885 RepID=A0AAN6FTP0_9PEZI|nr:hypothetical protein LTS00_012480 [Friedmanniomyces endolithicus]KAK0292780.1 hypothetical protein LTR35_000811 [Friedmanniomyces endolithicus]KAK0323292.1 hypothetical protein LTR82_005652 [Friedmanniomyces endolithicus]KAK1013571.1 hypothetical protein LTR54_004478 [Friedmanniomyces endolithicus]